MRVVLVVGCWRWFVHPRRMEAVGRPAEKGQSAHCFKIIPERMNSIGASTVAPIASELKVFSLQSNSLSCQKSSPSGAGRGKIRTCPLQKPTPLSAPPRRFPPRAVPAGSSQISMIRSR